MITAERARETFDYDPETGLFRRKDRRANQAAGVETSGWRTGAYLCLCIDYQQIKVHILAWLIVKGEYPKPFLDHVNRNKHDNRWANLRLATKAQNTVNAELRKNNRSGYRGVFWRSDRSVWSARIKTDGKYRSLGVFDTIEEAAQAYREASLNYYGEFANVVADRHC